MSLRWDVLLAILGMAAATYLCRAGGYALLRAFRAPPFVEALLQRLPGPLFVAYVVPALAQQGWTGWAGAAATLAVQARFGNLPLALLAGVALVAVLG